MEKESGLMQAARLFGALAEPARLRILQLLREGAMCGRELAARLDLTPATTCHHLDRLKLANLLSERRSGKFVYYSISDSELASAVKESLTAIGGEIELPAEEPVRKLRKRRRKVGSPPKKRKKSQ
jgi:ArsR family transcriptional regulator